MHVHLCAGVLPSTLRQLQSLQELNVNRNKLSGEFEPNRPVWVSRGNIRSTESILDVIFPISYGTLRPVLGSEEVTGLL